MRALGCILVGALAAACSDTAPAPPPTVAPARGADSATGSISVAPPGGVWVDPEPPGAQAIAEQNVAGAWNSDKVTRLEMSADKVTRLQMSITTLVNSTTGLVGARTGLAAAATTLDQRLTRLGAQVTGTEVTIRLPGSVLFDFDSAQIRPDAERTLTEVAEVLKAYGQRPMRVEGHTDSVATDDYNLKLSERRAQSVQAWLASRGGVKAAFATKGWGESKPAATNDTAAGRQQNRRVEVIIEKGG